MRTHHQFTRTPLPRGRQALVYRVWIAERDDMEPGWYVVVRVDVDGMCFRSMIGRIPEEDTHKVIESIAARPEGLIEAVYDALGLDQDGHTLH